jgi:hypothetical protein
VGLWGHLGAGTRLASGGEEREGLERSLARSCMHGSVLPLLPLFSQFFQHGQGWGVARGSAG